MGAAHQYGSMLAPGGGSMVARRHGSRTAEQQHSRVARLLHFGKAFTCLLSVCTAWLAGERLAAVGHLRSFVGGVRPHRRTRDQPVRMGEKSRGRR